MKAIRWALAIALAMLLTLPATAVGELETVMADFREEYHLDEGNFSLCYRDMVTGEEYRFNDKAFFLAGSTYKLPLNLYYYELEHDGTLGPGAYVGGLSLERAHEQSLVWSDNDVSIAMLYNLGSFRTYKDKMRKYFTMEGGEIASSYYTDNYYCTAMMLDTLRYLYERREEFPEMLDCMSRAQPGEYFKRYAGDTPVAHKYGFFYDEDTNTGVVNDVGIIEAPHPFLLAVYTKNAWDGAEVVARACERLLQYNEEHFGGPEAEPEADPQPEPQPEADPQPEPKPQPEPEPEPVSAPAAVQEPPEEAAEETEVSREAAEEPAQAPEEPPEAVVRRNIWWMVLVAAGIFLLADVGAIFWMKNGGLSRMEEKWGDEDEDEPPQLPESAPPEETEQRK